MTSSKYLLCAVPAPLWEQDIEWGGTPFDLCSSVEDALGIERRISKGVNLDNERTRYHLTCSRIEASIPPSFIIEPKNAEAVIQVLKDFRFPYIELDSRFLDLLKFIIANEPVIANKHRFAASFFPPSDIENHITAFDNVCNNLELNNDKNIVKRINFMKHSQKANCGIVVLYDPFFFDHDNDLENEVKTPTDVSPANVIGQTLYEEKETYFDNEDRNLYEILKEEIENALVISESGGMGEVNFSNQPHNVITEVIQEFVYIDDENFIKPTYIKVIYNDGSQGPPFPLKCIPKRSNASVSNNSIIRVALMSMRHLDLDHIVDMAWLRNREVSKSRALGETDAFCYEQSKKQFKEIFESKNTKIYLYHTGFQPAVLGFYRAFVEAIFVRNILIPNIEVIPQYHHRQRGYISGNSWN